MVLDLRYLFFLVFLILYRLPRKIQYYVSSVTLLHKWHGDVKTPCHKLLGEATSGRAAAQREIQILDPNKICCQCTWFRKNHCPRILESHLIFIFFILIALHLQGSKSNIYVHFHWVVSNWLGFHYESETINKACNWFWSQTYYKTLTSTGG